MPAARANADENNLELAYTTMPCLSGRRRASSGSSGITVPVRSAKPLLERLRQHSGSALVQQDYTAAVDVGVQLDRPVEFAHDQIGESGRSPVQRAACVDHTAIPAVGDAHVLTVALEWNDGKGLAVASCRVEKQATAGGRDETG